MKASRILVFIFFAFILWIIIYSFNYSAEASFGPLVIGIPLAVLIAVQIVREFLPGKSVKPEEKKPEACEPATATPTRKAYLGFVEVAACLIGLIAATYIFGIAIGFAVFMVVYLKTHRESWLMTLGLGRGMPALMYVVFELALKMILYKGIIFG